MANEAQNSFSPSPNELTHASQHAETNSNSISVDPSRSLNIEFPNSQNVRSSSPLSNAEPNYVTNEHSNTVSDLNRNPSELSSTSSSQSHFYFYFILHHVFFFLFSPLLNG